VPPVDHRSELGEVDAARNGRDPFRRCVVETQQVRCVLRTFGDDAVGVRDDAIFESRSVRAESVGRALVLAPHPAERVEGHHHRHSEPALSASPTKPDMKKFAWTRS
jgi:hypothetical protein